MAETDSTSSNVPYITVTAHKQSSHDGSNSSSSLTLDNNAPETPDIEKPSSPSQLPLETTADEVYMSEASISDAKEFRTPVASAHSSPKNILPLRTPNNVPSGPVKRKKQGKSPRRSPSVSINDNAPWHGVILDPSPQKEQAVVFPAKMVYASPNVPYNNNPWAFQRSTGYSDLVGSGFLFLKVHGEKERKNVKDNTYVFIVLEGAVEATIHQTSYAVATGGVFLVPRGNDYSVRNISEKEAKLFFTQARKPSPPDSLLAPNKQIIGSNTPSSKYLILADWLLQRLVSYTMRFHGQVYAWYWKYLMKYRHYFSRRSLYFIFFLLGLMIRRLPFIGSPPILNIQLLYLR